MPNEKKFYERKIVLIDYSGKLKANTIYKRKIEKNMEMGPCAALISQRIRSIRAALFTCYWNAFGISSIDFGGFS